MYEGNLVTLELEKTLDGAEVQKKTHECNVIEFDENKDRLTLLLRSGDLQELCLSAKYKCCIQNGDTGLLCSGEVSRRYRGEKGNIVEFYIENGFYKINIKSVDK